MTIPRSEYPRPQFVRQNWLNLNGQWQFEIDQGCSGEIRGLHNEGVALRNIINVPFCPESKLSGIGYTDFIYGVWYKRTVILGKMNGKTLLHFGAVDYHCRAYVNGTFVGEHKALHNETYVKCVAEDIWLNYFNRYLFECGTISEKEYKKMTEKIAIRKAKLSHERNAL